MIGGAHAGYNYHVGKWITGIEGSFSGANATGARNCSGYPYIYNCENDLNWLATATARVGYAWWDRSFVYAKGGLAIGNTDNRLRCNTGHLSLAATGALPLGCPATANNDTRVGWTVGGGSEFALTKAWSVRGETMYFDLGRSTLNTGLVAGLISEKTTGFVSTVGVSYRFN